MNPRETNYVTETYMKEANGMELLARKENKDHSTNNISRNSKQNSIFS